ncbi:hypothetical protein AY599_20485 [Leptolyngbya valderiana BDU 20041]|nr:hypothetical protein AY599_20485 [Leptolyngbya valderiana BDU 20041]
MSRSDRFKDDDDGLEFVDAAFDARLAGLFEAAAPPAHDPAFTARVVEQAGKTNRRRFLALGGAGLAGAAVAGGQLPRLSDGLFAELSGALGAPGDLVSAQMLVALALAGIALTFARVLSGTRSA